MQTEAFLLSIFEGAPWVGGISSARQWLSPWSWTPRLDGEHLWPYLKVYLDCGQREKTSGSFVAPLLVASPASAEVNVNWLIPTTCDLMLLDDARELAARRRKYAAPVAIELPSRIRT
jgi:hypothetical protein